jgi:hypothetical protein
MNNWLDPSSQPRGQKCLAFASNAVFSNTSFDDLSWKTITIHIKALTVDEQFNVNSPASVTRIATGEFHHSCF